MNIFLYDNKTIEIEDIHKLYLDFKDIFRSKGEDIIFLPKEFSVFLDCSIEQLVCFREVIERAIEKKEKEEIDKI